MPFKIPSQDETRAFLVAFKKALYPTQNVGSRKSWHGRKVTYLAGAVTQLHAHADSAQRDAHPLTAGDGPPIAAWGDAEGVPRKGATPAHKAAAGRVRGTGGTAVTSGLQLRHEASGLIFEIENGATIPGAPGVDGFVDCDIIASANAGSIGSVTNLSAGETLNFLSTPPGLQTAVVLQLDLQDGFDSEGFGSYRSRVLAALGQPSAGGNQADFVKWALASLNTIAAAFDYPNRAGRGTTDVAVFYAGSGASRAVSTADRALVLAYIQTQAPFQVAGPNLGGVAPLRVLTTIPDPQNVTILIETDGQAAFLFDWDDTSNPTVAAWEPGGVTNKLQFSAALPTTLRAGHRLILVGVATAQDGREYTIDSIAGSDSVILVETPPVAPAATDKIYSGGPVVTPIRDAIVAHLDGQIVYAGRGLTPLPAATAESQGVSIVNLDILAEGIGPANPGGKYNNPVGPSWSGGIIRASLFSIAKYQQGVRNVTITTPAADYEATDDPFPNDGQIHYITPGAVVIRRA
ncbi:MAG TPA: baseplate J/gp47 family protein [Solirubrobacter sp.]|nr:baseplate J/gp47 family protein [Solirubrobacter sp.]